MSRKIQLACLFLLLGLLSTAAQSGFAQSSVNPLAFGNNFFVTGDYVVAGTYGMTTHVANGFATGTITIPDANPGIQPGVNNTCIINNVIKKNCIPAGADIVAAILYWQTVEKTSVVPGQPGSGQNGFFGPVINGVPQFYPISGATSSQNTVSFSNGGCTGGSTGKAVRTYRAEVRGYLPQDLNGNILANATYEVRLPSTSSTTPITLGATLVIIYRILSPNVPLNSIVIYDGAFAPGGTLLNMTQTVEGFYQADKNPISRLTHIAGSGHSNKFQTVSLSSTDENGKVLNSVQLVSPYGSGQPAFPGYYGSWDNPTWTFTNPNTNPVQENAFAATTMVVPSTSQQGCPSWGAVIVSTTVKNTDGDGLLDAWKVPPAPYSSTPGYCDVGVNPGTCNGPTDPSWVDLTGAMLGTQQNPHPDVFVQLDYMCGILNSNGTCNAKTYSLTAAAAASGGNTTYTGTFSPIIPANSTLNITGFMNGGNNGLFTVQSNTSTQLVVNNPNGVAEANPGTAFGDSLNPSLAVDPDDNKNVVQKLVDAFAGSPNHAPVDLHVMPTHAIQEETCTDILGPPLSLCAFPNQPGVVAWKGGLLFIKNQPLNYTTEADCEANTPPAVPIGPNNCVRRFQHGRKDSYHYALFAHAAGLPNWTLLGGTLANVDPKSPGPNVMQSGFQVMFKTSTAHGLTNDPSCANDNNGLGRVTVAFATTNFNVNGTFVNLNGTYCVTVVDLFTFNIQAPFSTNFTYTFSTDPNLFVASGHAGTVSGFSDIGGADSLITLGNWKPQLQTPKVKAGTFMHELGHSLGLTHGGFYHDKLTANPPDYTPTIEANCKPNHQSVMSYMYQVDLLDNGGPTNVPDYSGQTLISVDKSSTTANPFGVLPYQTSWHGTQMELEAELGLHVVDNASPMKSRCDGSPLTPGALSVFRVTRVGNLLSWQGGQDINFDDSAITETSFRGHDDWTGTATIPGIDARQIGATGSLSTGGGFNGAGGGFNGAGGGLNGAGGGFNGAGGGFNGAGG